MCTHHLPIYIVCFVADVSVGLLHGFETEYFNIFGEDKSTVVCPCGDKGSGSRSLNLFSLQYLAKQLSAMSSSEKVSILVLDAHMV